MPIEISMPNRANNLNFLHAQINLIFQELHLNEENEFSVETGNQIPSPVMPSVNTYTTQEPISNDNDIKNTTDGKELYEWSETSEINPINEIVEFHNIDENENDLSSFEFDQEKQSTVNRETEYDQGTYSRYTTKTSLKSYPSSTTTSGNHDSR